MVLLCHTHYRPTNVTKRYDQETTASQFTLGRNPVSKHQIQPEYGDEQTDAGRDG